MRYTCSLDELSPYVHYPCACERNVIGYQARAPLSLSINCSAVKRDIVDTHSSSLPPALPKLFLAFRKALSACAGLLVDSRVTLPRFC